MLREDDRDEKHLAEARLRANNLLVSLPDRIQIAALTLNSKLPFKALSIRELLLHRMAAISTAAVDLFTQKRVIPAVILTRATIETLAVLFTLHERLDGFLKEQNKDIGQIDNFLMRCLMGAKNVPEMPAPVNILTFVDQVEKTLPGFRHAYDSLCEYAHPNWAGTLGAFGQIDKENFELHLGAAERSPAYSSGLTALSTSLMLFEHYYNDSAELIRKFNEHFEETRPDP